MDASIRAELIRKYAAGPVELANAWVELPAEARHFRPASQEWSAHEIICHCADSEMNSAMRIRTLVAEEDPVIVGYNQNTWVTVFASHDIEAELAIETIAMARKWTVPLLLHMTEAQWAAVGTHSESGTYSAIDWLNTYAVHLHDHADQIRSNLRAWNARNQSES